MEEKLSTRIKTGVKACLNALKEKGEVPDNWITHLFHLIDLLERQAEAQTIVVRVGWFGFCDCIIAERHCRGCWRLKENCTCVTLRVKPDALLNEELCRKHTQPVIEKSQKSQTEVVH
ncbi:MAG: hypothetical protein KatS3mg078_1323 [Deltaproteobacteria bacterium]|nr:MAG: hypothetical protein KatS3mg078_1323 [Deltaproteobacteria bacterium]